jgi:hypothetical protein
LPGEQHCYRKGSILIERPSILECRGKNAGMLTDADGTLELGSIELYRATPATFRVVTEWFDVLLAAANLTIEMN